MEETNTNENFTLTFRLSGRGKAQCPADPKHPNGVMIDLAGNKKSCLVNFKYPAPECGIWIARCNKCGFSAGITAAGRADDPRCAILPCKEIKNVS